MSKVMINLAQDHFYNIDFAKLRDELGSSFSITNASTGLKAKVDEFVLFIGQKGGLKVGIEFETLTELQQKLNSAFTKLEGLNAYYKEYYSEDIFDKLFLSWSSDYQHVKRNWNLAGEYYEEMVLPSDLGLNCSELVLI